MIVTKAFIDQLPEKDSNIYKVRIPLMEDNTGTPAIFDATSCHASGFFNEYAVEDCVYVCFEDEEMVSAVILGQLDLGKIPERNNVYSLIDNLNVTGYATLPENTKIGDYMLKDLLDNIDTAHSVAVSANTGLIFKEMRQW